MLNELSEQDASLEEAFVELTKDRVQFHAGVQTPELRREEVAA